MKFCKECNTVDPETTEQDGAVICLSCGAENSICGHDDGGEAA